MCETLRGFPPASTWPECPDTSVLVNYISKACLYMKEFRLKDIYSKYSANRKSKLHQQFGRATQHIAKKKKNGERACFLPAEEQCESMCVHVHVSYVCSCRWLAYTLVCVDVALAVRAGVCHILEVVDQAGNQTAAEVAPVGMGQMHKLSL